MFRFYQRRVDREVLFIGRHHLAAFGTEPDRDRGGKDPLAGDAPVPFHLLDPVLHPQEHVFGEPGDLVGCFLDLVRLDLHKPLPFGKDLDGRLAAPAGTNALGEFLLPFQDILRLHVGKDCRAALRGIQSFILAGNIGHPALPVDCLPEREIVLFPPVDILLVAECTDHHGAGTECGINRLILHHRHIVTEERYVHGLAFQPVVAVVAGVHGDSNAGCKELGAGGGDLHAIEIKVVEGCLAVLVSDFRKCDCRLAAGAVVDRVLALVDVAGLQHAQERELRLAVILRHHRDVLVGPVRGECHLPQGEAHCLDVFHGEVTAHFPELFPRDIVLRDMVEFFDFHFGREAVTVPSLREHHVEAFHPLVAGKEVDVAPVQRIPDMEITCRVRRGRVDHELGLFGFFIKIVVLIAPGPSPALLHFGKIIVLRQLI